MARNEITAITELMPPNGLREEIPAMKAKIWEQRKNIVGRCPAPSAIHSPRRQPTESQAKARSIGEVPEMSRKNWHANVIGLFAWSAFTGDA